MEGGYDAPVVPLELSDSDIREDLLYLARVVTTQANLSIMFRINVVESTILSRLRYILQMHPPISIGSMVGEDPQEFLDGVYMVLSTMRVTPREKAEFSSY